MLLGRLQLASGDKPYSPSDLQRKLSPLWGELGGWKLIPMGKGYYTFSFTSDASRAWVWAKGTIALKPGTMRFMNNIGHHVSTCKYVNPSPSLVGEQKRNGRGRSRRRRPKRNIKRATSQVYIPNHRSGKETIVDNTPTPVADSGEGPSFVRPSPEPNKDAVQDGQLQPITTSTKDTVIVLLLATASGIIQPPCTVEKTFMPIVHIEEEEQRVIELLRSNAELEVSHQDAGLLNIGLIGDNGEGDSATGTEVSDSECESIRNVDNSIGNWYDEFERQDALPEFTVVVSKATRKSMRKASKVENREAYLR
ncbi:hypothetical protein M0R45_019073 [Rubus argutus]|uniref:DUF4283 domain-containing protein n=1 Tax=Rubus argutus TaxID=59490 RepID=A0AAW1X692_RUBAR